MGDDEGSDDDDSNDDDEGSDDDDSNDDEEEDETKFCEKKIALAAKCCKNQRLAEKECEKSGIKNCAVVKMNKKCYYPQAKTLGKKYVSVFVKCGSDDNDGGKDDSDKDGKKDEECDSNAGLVFCLDCKCCKHEHMCDNPKRLL